MAGSETYNLDSLEDGASRGPDRREWWDGGEFTLRLGPIRRPLNAMLHDFCNELRSIFEARVGSDVDEAIEDAVRQDTVTASREAVRREFVLQKIQSAYAWLRDGGVVLAVVLAALFLSRGPSALELVLIVAAAGFMTVGLYADGLAGVTLLVGFGAVIGLIAHPVAGVSFGEAAGGALLAVVAVVVVVLLSDRVAGSLTRPVPAVLGLGVFAVSWLAVWRYVETEGWARWLSLAFDAWLIAGLGTAVVLVLLQFAYSVFPRFTDARTFRRVPEAEFVQSALWAIGGLEPRVTAPAESSGFELRSDILYQGVRTRWRRSDVVWALEYLATLLDQHVKAALAREDPGSAALAAEELSKRAEAFRAHKRHVLLGRPDTREPLLNALRTAVVYAAVRDWNALPEGAITTKTVKERRSEGARRFVGSGLMLAVPVMVAVVAWRADQPDVIAFAALWAAVSLAEILTPGAGGRLARSASDTDKAMTPLSKVRSSS